MTPNSDYPFSVRALYRQWFEQADRAADADLNPKRSAAHRRLAVFLLAECVRLARGNTAAGRNGEAAHG